MKKSHIAVLIMIAVAIGALMTSLGQTSTYADFSMVFDNPGEEYHLIGKINMEKPLVYNPEENPNLTTFFMQDTAGIEHKVFLHKAKPTDFEQSEQVVLIGAVKDQQFHANQVLMKCPSKYNDGNKEFLTPEEMAEQG